MNIRQIIIASTALFVFGILPAKEPITPTEALPLDPDSQDIVKELHRIGLPKYTEVEKQIIDRAKKLQDDQTAMYQKITVGSSVFDYPGLLAISKIHYDESHPIPYSLLLGIRPHIPEFSETFKQYSVQFDAKGIIQKKSVIIPPAAGEKMKIR